MDLCSGQITVYSLLDMIHLDSNVIENGRVHKMYVFFIFPLNWVEISILLVGWLCLEADRATVPHLEKYCVHLQKVGELEHKWTEWASEFIFLALMWMWEMQIAVYGVNSVDAWEPFCSVFGAWVLFCLYWKLYSDVCMFGSDGDVNGTEIQKNEMMSDFNLRVTARQESMKK